jgi:hypothetical protein
MRVKCIMRYLFIILIAGCCCSCLAREEVAVTDSFVAMEVDAFGGTNARQDLHIAVHRNGEAHPCGFAVLNPLNLAQTTSELNMTKNAPNKYQTEAILTQSFINELGPLCGKVDANNKTTGLTGWCDMGPSRTVIQNDHERLEKIANGNLPCRFYTREGRRIQSFDVLTQLANDAKEKCTNDACDSELHIYAVPAGRFFMLAPSHVGETFVIDFVEESLYDTIVIQTLSVEPRVFEIHDFFSPDEAQELIDKALSETSETHKFHRSTTGATDGKVFSQRTSDNAWDTHGKLAKKIKRRCLAMLGFDEYWESHTDGLQILRYQNAQAYVPHADYLDLDDNDDYNYDSSTVGGNRYATIFLYMSDVEEGGETVFADAWPVGLPEQDRVSTDDMIRQLRDNGTMDKLTPGSWEETMTAQCRTKFSTKPKKGRAILFYSQHPTGIEDKGVLHGGCPVLAGTKWAANLWVWSAPRAEFAHAPKKHDDPATDPTTTHRKIVATFTNTGKDPKFDTAELHYGEGGFYGKVGVGQSASVNTYKTHVWHIRVGGENGEILETISIDDDSLPLREYRF